MAHEWIMEVIPHMCWLYVLQNKSIDIANVQLSEILSWVTEYWSKLQPQKFTKGKKYFRFYLLVFLIVDPEESNP